MEKKKESEFLKLLGLTGTKDILEFMDEHRTTHYMQLAKYINVHILNLRLRKLLEYGLIQHHLERMRVKREWYTITEKGRKVLNHLQEIVKMMEG